jgi:hypothetical protein
MDSAIASKKFRLLSSIIHHSLTNRPAQPHYPYGFR